MSTYGIHALKLTRPRTEPSARIGVIAANTNWKYTSVAVGKWNGGPVEIDGISAWPSSPTWPSTLPPSPHIVPRNPCVPNTPEPLCAMGLPKPILNAHRHQAMSVRENATNVSIMLFTDQRFCITPPYRTARPGRLMSPTSVAAVICQALSPAFSHVGYAFQDMCLHFPPLSTRSHPSRAHAGGSAPIASDMKSDGAGDRQGHPGQHVQPGFRHLSR